MARSIQEIKQEVAREFMRNELAAERYGFVPGSEFDTFFSAASVENVLLYAWAVGAWALEKLLDAFKAEVCDMVDRGSAHRPKWYRDKALAFMAGKALAGDSDAYDTTGMSTEEIDAARVVRHAVAVESRDASLLTIKVAGESGGTRRPISAEHERQLGVYLSEVKDAGVRVAVVNMEGDRFDCEADVYYDPLLDAGVVREECAAAIRDYIANLPFNGEYTNMALVDRLQGVSGVKIAELRWSRSASADGGVPQEINARQTPVAGYFNPGAITVNMIAYE